MVPHTPLVLVVGGDMFTRALLRSTLAMLRYDSYLATIDTLTMAPTPPEVTALVLVYPAASMSFSRTLIRLRHLGYQAPAILLSARPSRALRRQAFMRGVLDVVSLPVEPRELRARLHAAAQEPGRYDSAVGLVEMLHADDK